MDSATSKQILLVDEHSNMNIFRMKEKKKELSKQFKATEKLREKVRS